MRKNKESDYLKRKEKRRQIAKEKRAPIQVIEGEAWMDIIGFEGLYQVSSYGRVKSLEKQVRCRRTAISTLPERLLTPKVINCYKSVSLSKDGKACIHKVHRLVALHFVSNPNNKPFVNHLDFDKFNNNKENLEWTTARENTHHYQAQKTKTGFVGVYWAKGISKYVAGLRANGKFNYIGVFKIKEDAIKAYEEKKKELGLF
jgi:hypothetical protein